MSLNHDEIRAQFPQLQHTHNGQPVIFPGWTGRYPSARTGYPGRGGSYAPLHGAAGAPFPLSQQSLAMVNETRAKMMAFLNAYRPDEILFGANMTTLTMAISRRPGPRLGTRR